MQMIDRRSLIVGAIFLAACGRPEEESFDSALHLNETPELRRLINHHADTNGVPRSLVHRVVVRESNHRPSARHGPYYGLMQLLPQTARGMGFRGADADLLDADTNLRYGVKYLRGAWLVADRDPDRAISWYSRGYYYEAKRRGMLDVTGLRG